MPNTAAEARFVSRSVLDIAVGVLVDPQGRLLLARRRPNTPGAGLWEFPGGKREPGESMHRCLVRELAEEIGIGTPRGRPLIRFRHDRGERPVRLHVWRIDAWEGEPAGLEGQRLAWVAPEALAGYDLLPATGVILNALELPVCYAITPPDFGTAPADWDRARALFESGLRWLRLRLPDTNDADYTAIAKRLVALARAQGARLLVDRDAELCARIGAHGLHWPVARLVAQGRPAGVDWLAVSAHTGEDLAAAARGDADFATLSPVAATASHVDTPALGWPGFSRRRGDHALPVYALGGLDARCVTIAQAHHAHGVAAIRGFWPR